MSEQVIRLATLDDVKNLENLENAVFAGNKLNARRFRHFIKSELSELWCVEENSELLGYALVLFHRGTSLARLYSLAVSPQARGRKLGQVLLEHAEKHAIERHVLFMRLEVRQDNPAALHLYERTGYQKLKVLTHYYEDGGDGWRLEKRLHQAIPLPENLPFYYQTTPFTCGPSALLMAWQSLTAKPVISRVEELNIWREATTIYLTTGHGGTSAQGLALAAQARGLKAQLWLSADDVPFIDGVRSEHKREVMQLVAEDFAKRCQREKIRTRLGGFSCEDLRKALAQGKRILLLISTWRLNRNKAPHWVWLVDMDKNYAYINDPDVDEKLEQIELDNLYVPVSMANFSAMIQYGSKRYTAAVLLSN